MNDVTRIKTAALAVRKATARLVAVGRKITALEKQQQAADMELSTARQEYRRVVESITQEPLPR